MCCHLRCMRPFRNPGVTSAATKVAGATSAATSAATAAATKSAATPAAGATGKATVNVGDSAIGKVLVDDKGFTLYTFKNDVANSGKSAVPAAIAANWPPLVATGTAAKGAGVTGDLGTATLDGGSKVVSYKGLPLYRFINDKAPGDTKGDKVAGIWFVAVPYGARHQPQFDNHGQQQPTALTRARSVCASASLC